MSLPEDIKNTINEHISMLLENKYNIKVDLKELQDSTDSKDHKDHKDNKDNKGNKDDKKQGGIKGFKPLKHEIEIYKQLLLLEKGIEYVPIGYTSGKSGSARSSIEYTPNPMNMNEKKNDSLKD